MAVQAPTIADFSADSGSLGDGVTDSNVVTLWGKGSSNSTITVYDGPTKLGTTTTDASGAWSFTTPKLADSTHSLSATATDAAGTSPSSAAMSIKVVPSVTQLVSGTDNWSNPTIIDGQGWYNENAGKSWSLTSPDSHTVRTEVRAGDYWADGGNSSRSEILAANSVTNGQTFNASYSMTVEPGTSNVGSGLSWLSLTQMYGANGATFSIQLKGEQMAVVVNLNEATEKQVYLDPNPIERGQAYNIQIQAHFAADSSGYLDIWRDGVQIVDYHGVLGDPGADYNLKLGIYRGDPSNANYTMAADYSNIVTSTDAAFPTPPFGGATSSGGTTGSVTQPATGSASGSSTAGNAGTGTGTTSGGGSVTDPAGGNGSVSGPGSTSANTGTPGGATSSKAPTVTVADPTLSVSPGRRNGIDLGVNVGIPKAGDNVTVNIKGLPAYETITDKLDHKTFSGSNITLTAAEANSGLTLTSSYKGSGHPTATLTVTATDHTTKSSSAAQSIIVTDPPSSSVTSATGSGSTGTASTPAGSSGTRGSGSSWHGGLSAPHGDVSQWFDSHPDFARATKTLSDAMTSSKSGSATSLAGSSSGSAASAGDKAYALLNQMMAADFGNGSHFAQGGFSSAQNQQQPSGLLTRPLR